MGLSYTVLGILFLALVIIDCSVAADLEVQGDSKTSKNVKASDISNKNNSGKEKVVIPEEKGKDQVGSGLKEGADDKMNKDISSKQVGLKGADGEQKKTYNKGSGEKKTDDMGSEQKKTDNKGSGQKKTDDSGSEPKKTDNKGSGQKKTDDSGSEPKKTDNKGQKKTDDTGSEQKKTDKGSGQKKTDDTGSEKEKPNDTGSKKVDKKEKARGDLGSQSKDNSVAQVRKEGGEVCDSSSNRCTIEEMSVIACLRVAGSDSEELSLLIQNKGKVPLSVTISAPDFVQLEKKQIQVQDNKNEKVKVSIGNGERSGIILKAGDGKCTIDFKEMRTQNSKKDAVSAQLAYTKLLKSTPSVWFIFFAAVVVIAAVCIGISFRRKYVARKSPSYEKLEMELPVSGVSRTAPDSNDGWDDTWGDSWGDSWDDEEAPKTPSMPVTPSLSSHGISSRRINKDAWKDK